MRNSRKAFMVFMMVFITVILSMVPANACTVFRISDGQTVLFGNNEDWFDKDTYIWFVPGEEGKYGRVFFGFENAYPQGGMNTEGLAYDCFARGGDIAPNDLSKPDYPGILTDELLEKCATVEEALAIFDKYYYPHLGYAEMLLSDRTGASAMVTWDWSQKKVLVTRDQEGCQVIGVGKTAAEEAFLKHKKVNMITTRVMLEDASNENTLYSNVFNLKSGEITLYNRHRFRDAITLNLADELRKGKHLYYIQDLFGSRQKEGPDEMTPSGFLSKSQQTLFLLLTVVYALSVIFSVFMLIRKKNVKTERLVHTNNAAHGLSMLGVIAYIFFMGRFLFKYGASMIPLMSVLPWIVLLTFLIQLYLVKTTYRKGRFGIGYKLYSSGLLLLSSACLYAIIRYGLLLG